MCAFTATMYHECAIASLFPRSASETNRERNGEEGEAVVTEELYDDVQQQTPPPPPPKLSSPLTIALPPIPMTAEEEEEEMEREVIHTRAGMWQRRAQFVPSGTGKIVKLRCGDVQQRQTCRCAVRSLASTTSNLLTAVMC